MENWLEKYREGLEEKKTYLTVGLDPIQERIPKGFRDGGEGVMDFLKEIVNITHPYTIAYKLNSAFYESMGEKGFGVIKETLEYIKKLDEKILILFDGKRGDISHTAEMYARAVFDLLRFDGTTVNPYMGWDAVAPFYKRKGRLILLLVRTSNKTGGEVQLWGNPPLYLEIARLIKDEDERGDVGAVVGATYPMELKEVRRVIGEERIILVPGVGAQGGSVEDVLKYGNGNLLINVSRGIVQSWEKDGWPEGVKKAIKRYSQMMRHK